MNGRKVVGGIEVKGEEIRGSLPQRKPQIIHVADFKLDAESYRRDQGVRISSIFGHLGSSLFRVSAYAASKGGVENLTRQLAVEWAADGITVNAIAPSWFPSEMTAGSLQKESIVERMSSGAPIRRMGRPGELRTACLFLAAPASSYVTGTTVPVDGGYSAW